MANFKTSGRLCIVCVLVDIVALMQGKYLGIFMTYIKTLIKESLRDNDNLQ